MHKLLHVFTQKSVCYEYKPLLTSLLAPRFPWSPCLSSELEKRLTWQPKQETTLIASWLWQRSSAWGTSGRLCATRDSVVSCACAQTSFFQVKYATNWLTSMWWETQRSDKMPHDVTDFYVCIGLDFHLIFVLTDIWSWSTQTATLNQRRASSNYSLILEAPDWPGFSSKKTLYVTEIWRPSENRWAFAGLVRPE